MQPWQVAVGISIAILVPLGYVVQYELAYLSGSWPLVMAHYGYHVVMAVLTVYLTLVFGVYSLARSLVLGDVGQRVTVMDKTIREGRAGDPELADALQREESGNYDS